MPFVSTRLHAGHGREREDGLAQRIPSAITGGHRRTFTLAVVGLMAATLLAPVPGAAQRPIKVGYPMTLSGPGALFGEPALKGAQMFVAETNARGGVLGRKFELIPRDTRSNADEAVRISRELIRSWISDMGAPTWPPSPILEHPGAAGALLYTPTGLLGARGAPAGCVPGGDLLA